MKLTKNAVVDHGLAIFTILVWGVTFISTKTLSEHFSAMEILFLRYFIAYIALWIACPRTLKVKSLRDEIYILGAGLSGALVYQYLENLSVSYTNPASVCFITALSPVFTAIFAYFFLREKVNAKLFIGMAVCLVGVFLVSFGDSKTIETGLLGDVIIFCGVWLWAVYSILIKKIDSFGYSDVLVTRRVFFYALVFMLPFMAVRAPHIDYAALADASSVLNLLFLGVLASAVCFYTWNRSVIRLGATATSKYLFAMPAVTLIVQIITGSGTVSVASVAGMAVIFAGLAVIGKK